MKTPISNLRVSFAVLLIAISSLSVAQQYTVTDLGTLGGKTAEGFAVNDLGQVAGFSLDKSGKEHAIMWSSSLGMIDLGYLRQTDAFSVAYGINNNGQIVGASGPSAFLWTKVGGMQDLGTLGGESATAYGINNSGLVVGTSVLSDNITNHAFLWTATTGMEDLGTLGGSLSTAFAMNDLGQVVGTSEISDTQAAAFIWTATGGMQSLGTLGGTGSVAAAINTSGQVAGNSATTTNPTVAFTWDQIHGMQSISTPTTAFTFATGINSLGQIVGNWEPAPAGSIAASNIVPPRVPVSHGFLWTKSRGLQSLNSLLITRNILVVAAYAINGKEQIAGFGNNGHAILLNPKK